MDFMSRFTKFASIILLCSLMSCTSTNQLLISDQIRLGMSIESTCNATVMTSIVDDPCMGYSSYIEDKNALILYNSNNTLYLVFENVTGSDFRRSGGRNSKLILIASTYQEANFYVQNIIN